MLWDVLFWAGLAVAAGIGFVYFRDLGDVSQMVLKVKRENMIRFIRHEYRFVAIGLSAAAVMVVAHILGGGWSWAFWIALPVIAFLYVFPWVWVHLGLRNQQDNAIYVPAAAARDHINPSASVMVIENKGHARAHSDAQLMRPHLAGDAAGLGGEDVVMTYCAMANLGLGYAPSIEGRRLKLEVLAQHGNNLILRDDSGEPIQHIYGFRESDGEARPDGQVCALRPALSMTPWSTFRMTFRAFQKAYPEGEVFLNRPPANPLLRAFDMLTETIFSSGIARQHQDAAPVMDNMSRTDDRLPNKTYVWGIDIDGDAVAYTDDFVMQHDGPVNAEIGGRRIVVAHDRVHESVGAWYNDTGGDVREIDFFGRSDRGVLPRVERLKAGMFWHVWAEFFPGTAINRTGAEPA